MDKLSEWAAPIQQSAERIMEAMRIGLGPRR
jgi:hypothetical protein